MSYEELRILLESTQLFEDATVQDILHVCGSASVGNAVVACEILELDLCGNDIDTMYHALYNQD